MKTLSSQQKRKANAMRKLRKMDSMEIFVRKQAKERFATPPYGGRKV